MQSISSNNLLMMEKSMDYLWAKQTAILDNIANAETPHYKSKTVYFEQALQQKLEAASQKKCPGAALREVIKQADWRVRETESSTRLDGNSVNLTEQNMELVRTAYQLQYAMQAISSDLGTLRKAITG